ncbi:MAG: TRAM domain-containing protein [Nanoarchaeota archaeon]
MMNMGPNRFAPVRVGEEIDVKIEAVGEKGDGIAKKNGFVLFVPNTKAGDEVRIRVSRVMKKVGFADVVGKAQGPIGTEPVHQMPKPRREEPREEIQIDESKDSEDFGEDDTEDPAEPADEDEDK